jgi:hypothetical protein
MRAEREHLFDRPSNVRRLLRTLYGVCALLFAVEFLYHRHAQHPWDGWSGFYAGYGFAGCVLLVLIAKGLRRFLRRPEDYYGDGADPP